MKASSVKLTQTKTIPLTAAVLMKAFRALTFGTIVIKKYNFFFQSIELMPTFLFGASVGARGRAPTGDGGGACGTVLTGWVFLVRRVLISLCLW